MGKQMVLHLLAAGYEVTVYNRTAGKAQEAVEAGAAMADSAGATALSSDLVITMVGYPEDVERIYRGAGGIFERAAAGTVLMDMTTSRPDLARELANEAEQAGLVMMDAPVSGGDRGAREGNLTVMAGGNGKALERVRPVLECFARSIVHHGDAGSGQFCKMGNQIAIASGMVGVCEALAYARAAGLDPETFLHSISAGAAGSWSLSHLAPRMLAGDFAPGFYVKHFLKDLGIALISARELGIDLPGLELAQRLYTELASAGYEDDGTHALYRLYQG